MVLMAWLASVAPGIWMRMDLSPCFWTVVSDAPSEFTRFWTMVVAVAMSSADGADPSGLLAVMMTDTPPRMSSPWVIFSPTGVNAMTHATRTASSTTSVDA